MIFRYFSAAAIISAVLVVGCSSKVDPTSSVATSKFQDVRIEFAGFIKSKGGATWTGWPDEVEEALLGLPAVTKIKKELDRDQFVVTLDVNQMSVDELMVAAKKTGKEPRLVTEEIASNNVEAEVTDASDVPIPPEVVKARENAKAKNKLLILDFGATWCAPCKRLVNETFVDDKVKSLLENVELVKIDADEHPEFTQSLNVSSLPDVRFYSPNGKQIDRLLEFVEAEPFVKLLEKNLTAIKNIENKLNVEK